MKFLQTLLALLTVMVIAGVVLYEVEEKLGPGPLHPAHAQVADLASGECSLCHHPDGGTRIAETCAGCHEEIGAQIRDRSGVHGSLETAIANDCGECHVEHHGNEIALVSAHAFALAGIDDLESYDHRHAKSFDLHGAHEGLDCTACHEHANDEVLAEGHARFLGQPVSKNCQGCHEDVHEGTYGEDCARCHGQSAPFPQVGEFHHRRFEIDGSHQGLRCDACHEPGSDHGIDLLQAIDPDPRTCQACHTNPHGPNGESLPVAGISGDCAQCHTTTGFERTFGRRDHLAIGVHLDGAHGRADCAACHTDAQAAVARIPDRMSRCTGCHESPHDEVFLRDVIAVSAGRVDEENNCSLCHSDSNRPFQDGSIEPDLHAATGFPLDAPHDALDCSACHQGSEPSVSTIGFRERFPGRSPSDCRACHDDPHGGQFDSGPTEGRCIDCHERTHFLPAAFDLAAHDRCDFPLEASHRAVSCNRCHEDPAEPQMPRRFAGTPTACADCHEDVHRGTFDRPGVPAAVDGRIGCARCHDTGSFREIGQVFDHEFFTGYSLVGAHATASCADCHGRSANPGPGGRTLGQAPTACASCHEDPHVGQFARVEAGVAPPTDCARCHAPDREFARLTFDHDRDSQFPLDADHAALSCSACHRPQTLPSGREVVRYRPLGRSCKDCHGGAGRPVRSGGGR